MIHANEVMRNNELYSTLTGASGPAALLENLIVFDANCILCSGFARFMARHDRHAYFRFVNAHSETGQRLYRQFSLDPDLMDTNIVILEGKAFTRMASFTVAMRSLGWPWRVLCLLDLLPQKPADWLYGQIARNRYRFGRRNCPLPSQDLRGRVVD
ncbi:thiol-disulfide oxidoreductase DCC family protein [Roseibium sp. SCP14]|uniref:thiol-disulfide oxidoreductase DCC family protein n=1 Tax=Roseibium sp. SCP14 TaxID=3141375 RepID=UPI0033386169